VYSDNDVINATELISEDITHPTTPMYEIADKGLASNAVFVDFMAVVEEYRNTKNVNFLLSTVKLSSPN
jgi:hypothetical protein